MGHNPLRLPRVFRSSIFNLRSFEGWYSSPPAPTRPRRSAVDPEPTFMAWPAVDWRRPRSGHSARLSACGNCGRRAARACLLRRWSVSARGAALSLCHRRLPRVSGGGREHWAESGSSGGWRRSWPLMSRNVQRWASG